MGPRDADWYGRLEVAGSGNSRRKKAVIVRLSQELGESDERNLYVRSPGVQ